MNNTARQSLTELADMLALSVQQFHAGGKLPTGEILLNLDNSEWLHNAPFAFDMVAGTLHRFSCDAIPQSSRSALYFLDTIPAGSDFVSCPVCRPEPGVPSSTGAQNGALDLFWGVVSFFDQFGSVLRERGREFRQSNRADEFLSGLEQNFTAARRLDPGPCASGQPIISL